MCGAVAPRGTPGPEARALACCCCSARPAGSNRVSPRFSARSSLVSPSPGFGQPWSLGSGILSALAVGGWRSAGDAPAGFGQAWWAVWAAVFGAFCVVQCLATSSKLGILVHLIFWASRSCDFIAYSFWGSRIGILWSALLVAVATRLILRLKRWDFPPSSPQSSFFSLIPLCTFSPR